MNNSNALRYSKEIATIAKVYTDDQKYNRTSNSFDFKLSVFYNICKRANLHLEGYMLAFPTMLKGLALSHYYNCSLSTKTFIDACNYMQNFFKGTEYYWKNFTEWNTITLQEIINANLDKFIINYLQLLVN